MARRKNTDAGRAPSPPGEPSAKSDDFVNRFAVEIINLSRFLSRCSHYKCVCRFKLTPSLVLHCSIRTGSYCFGIVYSGIVHLYLLLLRF